MAEESSIKCILTLMVLIFHELVEESVARTPPHLEPIVPDSGNRLRIKPFT